MSTPWGYIAVMHSFRRTLATALLTTALLIVAAITALPLIWMVGRSFLVEGTAISSLTSRLSLEHYRHLLTNYPAMQWFSNSLFIAGMQTLIACGACTLAGYVLAHHHFPRRRIYLVILVATLLLPSQVALPAAWRLMYKLHLLDSYLSLLLPAAASAFGVLLFRQAASQIPVDLLDAARMDGCSEWRIWWDVVLPVIQPTLVTFAVLSFTANWNAYLWPQILLQDSRKYTLAMGLANLGALPQQRADIGLMLAATALSVLPSLVLFLAARKSLESSITEGSVK
jgi:ABC-type glycerol-3-phosphate transport system permease component